jgi:hypothetical protein
MKADAFEFFDRQFQCLRDDEGKSYLVLWRHVGQLVELAGESNNPLIRSGSSLAYKLEWIELERMAQIRLLRIAARYRASGEILRLKDPYGRDLLHAVRGIRMKFWSLGNDGLDDGGDAGSHGRWTLPRFVPGAPSPRWAKDLVIDVEQFRPQ